MIFKVRSDEDDPKSAKEIKAYDEESAAEAYAEANFSRLDYPEEMELWVVDQNGIETKWDVEVRPVPHFNARKVTPK